MTWQQARKDAELRLRAFLKRIICEGRDAREVQTTLPLYEEEKMLEAMEPENKWPLQYHQQVTRAAMRILRTHKFPVSIVRLTEDDYMQWLDGQIDTPEMRRQFVREKLGNGSIQREMGFDEHSRRRLVS